MYYPHDVNNSHSSIILWFIWEKTFNGQKIIEWAYRTDTTVSAHFLKPIFGQKKSSHFPVYTIAFFLLLFIQLVTGMFCRGGAGGVELGW